MPNGFPSFPQSLFPNDKPPSLFHPASPKMKPSTTTNQAVENTKEADTASIASTATFSSSVSLLKKKFKSSAEKEEGKKEKVKKEKKQRSPEEWNARARTAEAYFVQATLR